MAFGEVMMRMQVPGHELLTQANELKYSFSGTGVNIASAVSRLGHNGSILTTLPNNALGDAAQSYLRKLGITDQFIKRDGHYIGMYFLENGFGVRSSRVTYTNRMESSFNTANEALYDFEEIAQQVDVVHFCGITLAMNDHVRNQMKILAKAVKDANGIVVFDCNYRPSLWRPSSSSSAAKNDPNGYEKARRHYEEMLYLADIVMMNEQDAMLTLGMKTGEKTRKDQLINLIPAVAKKYKISVIAGTHRTINDHNTHSLQGYIFKEGKFTFSSKITFSVLDRIGAGDAYTSGIIHGKLVGYSPQDTVNFATTAGMLAHTIVGDTPVATKQDIFQALNHTIRDVER